MRISLLSNWYLMGAVSKVDVEQRKVLGVGLRAWGLGLRLRASGLRFGFRALTL